MYRSSIAVCALLVPILLFAEPELIKNSGFEEGAQGWSWEQWAGKPEPGGIDTKKNFSGTSSYRLSMPGIDGERWISGGGIVLAAIADYEFTIAIACENVPRDAVRVQVLQYGTEKDAGKVEPQGWLWFGPNNDGNIVKTGGSHDWKEFKVRIPSSAIKPTTKKLGIYIRHREIGIGTAWIDALSLSMVPGTETAKIEQLVTETKTASAPKNEAPQTGNLLSGDTSFETGTDDWKDSASSEGGTSGKYCLALPARAVSTRSPNYYDVIRPGTTYTVSFDAKSDVPLSVIVDVWHTSYFIMKRETVQLSPQWKRYSFEVPAQKEKHSLYIVFQKEGSGTMMLDALSCTANNAAGAATSADTVYRSCEAVSANMIMRTKEPGNVFLAGPETVEIEARIHNATEASSSFSLQSACVDLDGNEISRSTRAFTANRGDTVALPFTALTSRTAGYFTARMTVHAGGKSVKSMEMPIVVVKAPRASGENEGSFFGLQGSGIPMEAISRIGVKWMRNFRAWRWTERKKGEIYINDDSYLSQRTNGMHIMETLQATMMPDWAKGSDGKMKDIVEYCNYASLMVKQFGKYSRYWEIENEPDLVFPSHAKLSYLDGAKYYADVLIRASKAIKAADPNAVVLGSGVSGGDFNGFAFSKKVFELAADAFDIWAFHPYAPSRNIGPSGICVTPEENRMRENLLDAEKIIKDNGGRHRLWIGELGWAITTNNPSFVSSYARQHAEMMTRAMILAHSVPTLEHIFWFLTQGCLEGGYEYGLWKDERRPLPAVAAYATITRMLDNTVPVRPLYESDLRAYAFATRDGNPVIAIWKSAGEATELIVSVKPDAVRLTDMVGVDVTLATRGNGIVIPLSGSPRYLRSISMSVEQLCAAVEKAAVSIDAVSISVLMGDRSSIAGSLKNNLPTKIDGTLTIAVPDGMSAENTSQPFSLAPSGSSSFRFGISSGDTERLRGKEIVLTARMDGGSVVKRLPASAEKCTQRTIAFDTDLSAWRAIPSFTLDERIYIMPPDAAPTVWKTPENLSAVAYTAWDEQYFYFAANVRDNMFCQEWSGGDVWKGDSIQLSFDAKNDAVEKKVGYDGNDHEFSIALTKSGPAVYRHAGPKELPQGPVKGAKIDIRTQGDYTVYQLALPWSELSPLRPTAGRMFGFNFIINDNDGTGRAYWMGLTPGIGEMKYPYVFRKFALSGK
ncbi:MAG: sugar-binding protein [Spirochaetota bacterium]